MAGKGGKTPGAGRKPNKVNLLRKSAALGLLSEEQEKNRWRKFLAHEDDELAFKAFIEWNNRAFGKPAQAVDMTSKGESIAQIIVNL
jgi:hypothetical protein